MKKLISVALVLVLLLAGCAPEEFTLDNAIAQLQGEGLTMSQNHTQAADLERDTEITNSSIKFDGGDFTVEVTRYISMIKDGDASQNCCFMELATEEQAQTYAQFYVAERSSGNRFQVARVGRIVVLTNLEEAREALDLEFQ